MAGWRGDSQYIPNSSFTTGFLNLPSELDIRSSIRTETFRPFSPTPPKEDIILMAEFSEIEGPMPLITIPHTPPLHVDLNDFVVKVMSTDYLNTSGEFRVCADTQMVQQDIEPGIHVYVHYFTLYDVRARGFVRPMCLSYITMDSRKLLKYFSQLRQQFSAATAYLKRSNLVWFAKEMQGLITNLEYTKDRYIQMQRNVHQSSPQSSPSDAVQEFYSNDEDDFEVVEGSAKIGNAFSDTKHTAKDQEAPSSKFSQTSPSLREQGRRNSDGFKDVRSSNIPVHNRVKEEEDEESLLRHTSLEAVALQLMECQHILDIIKPHLDKKEIQEDLNRLSTEVISKPQSPLCKTMSKLLMLEKPEENTQPNICILSLMKRNFSVMRSVQMLCGFGYIGCLMKLRSIHEKYKKNHLTLLFEDLDSQIYDNPFGSLFIGNIPIISIMKMNNTPMSVQTNSYASLCWDDHFVKLLSSGVSQLSTPDSEYADAVEVPREGSIVSEAVDCLQVFPVRRDVEGKESNSSNDAKVETVKSQSLENLHSEECTEDQSSESNVTEECHESQEIVKKLRDGVNSNGKQPSISPRSSSSGSSLSSNRQYEWLHFEGIEEEEVVQECVAAALGEQLQPRANIDERMTTSQTCRLSGLVQKFCGVSHCVVHALLSGRPIVLAAADSYKNLVMMYVRALSTLLPCSTLQQLPILKWHTGTITNHHIKQFQVMGVCIPERLHVQDLMSNATLNRVTVLNIETGHISGVAYGGNLVRGVEQYVRKLFSSNSALQASLQAILVSLGLKVYLLYHLQETTDRSTKDILKGIGVAKGDWDIVTHLCGVVQSQIKSSL